MRRVSQHASHANVIRSGILLVEPPLHVASLIVLPANDCRDGGPDELPQPLGRGGLIAQLPCGVGGEPGEQAAFELRIGGLRCRMGGVPHGEKITGQRRIIPLDHRLGKAQPELPV